MPLLHVVGQGQAVFERSHYVNVLCGKRNENQIGKRDNTFVKPTTQIKENVIVGMTNFLNLQFV